MRCFLSLSHSLNDRGDKTPQDLLFDAAFSARRHCNPDDQFQFACFGYGDAHTRLDRQGGKPSILAEPLVMRGLALREIVPGTKKRVISKEALAGLINGLAVAMVTALAVYGWRVLNDDPFQRCIGLALVIGLSMTVNMLAAAFSGAVIPLILKAVGRDPAQSASIFLTTVTDIVGFASFLGFAVLFSSLLF